MPQRETTLEDLMYTMREGFEEVRTTRRLCQQALNEIASLERRTRNNERAIVHIVAHLPDMPDIPEG